MPADETVPVPDAVDDVSAVGALLQGMTAWILVHTTYPVQPGDDVLVHAAAGGVGLLLTQLATRARRPGDRHRVHRREGGAGQGRGRRRGAALLRRPGRAGARPHRRRRRGGGLRRRRQVDRSTPAWTPCAAAACSCSSARRAGRCRRSTRSGSTRAARSTSPARRCSTTSPRARSCSAPRSSVYAEVADGPPRRPHRRTATPLHEARDGARGPPGPPHDRQTGAHSVTSWGDLQAFQDLPRLAGLAVSPDGARLVTTVATPDPTAPASAPRCGRSTRRACARPQADAGAPARPRPRSSPTATCSSPRPAPTPTATEPDEDAPAALWRLPPRARPTWWARGRAGSRRPGRPRRGHRRRLGDDAARAPSPTRTTRPAARPATRRRSTRSCTPRTRCGSGTTTSGRTNSGCWSAPYRPTRIAWRDLTPTPGRALGAFAVTAGRRTASSPSGRCPSAAAAAARRWWSSTSRPVRAGRSLDDPAADFVAPTISPDGTRVACVRETRSTPTAPIDRILLVVPLAGGEPTQLAAGWDRWPERARWAPTATRSSSPPTTGAAARCSASPAADPVRLTGDDGFYSDLVAAPDGSTLYALRSAIDAPPAPVRLDPTAPDQQPGAAARPGRAAPSVPGTLTEVTATAADGTPLRAWLVLPAGAGPTPGAARCSGSTAARCAAGTPGSGGGTRGSWPPAATPCCCPTRRCPPATGALRRPRLGRVGRRALHRPHGAHRRRRRPTPASTPTPSPRWAAPSAATWPTGWRATPTGSARSSPTPACGPSTVRPHDRRRRPTGAAR